MKTNTVRQIGQTYIYLNVLDYLNDTNNRLQWIPDICHNFKKSSLRTQFDMCYYFSYLTLHQVYGLFKVIIHIYLHVPGIIPLIEIFYDKKIHYINIIIDNV